MEIGILASIALVVILLFAASNAPRKKRTPYYYRSGQVGATKMHGQLVAGESVGVEEVRESAAPQGEGKFSDLFEVAIDSRSWDFYSDHRRRHDLVRLEYDIRKAGIEVAIAERMNALDAQINQLAVTQKEFDFAQQKAVLELMTAKQGILEEALKVKTGEAQNALKGQLLEVQKAQFAHQKGMMLDYFEREQWKLGVRVQEFEIAKYFHQKYQTLEAQKIQLAHQRDRHALQQDRDNISNLLSRLDVREARARIREDASALMVRENRLALRTDEYDFLQRRAVKHLKFESLEAYMESWKNMNDLARDNGFSSVEGCVYSLLHGGQLASLLETKREFEQLKTRFRQLQATTGELDDGANG